MSRLLTLSSAAGLLLSSAAFAAPPTGHYDGQVTTPNGPLMSSVTIWCPDPNNLGASIPCPNSSAAQTSVTASIDTVPLTAANTAQNLPNIATTFGATLQNQSTTDTIYVGVSSAVTSAGAHGYKLVPGQVLGVSAANLNAYWFVGPTTSSTLGYSVN